jgi:hypothetical protein
VFLLLAVVLGEVVLVQVLSDNYASRMNDN